MNMINSFFLVGPMGVGKTTLGKLLAKKLNYSFIDSDIWIEETEKQSIPAIFSAFGETVFRDIESRAIDTLTNQSNIILSTGGGAILRDINRERLKTRGKVIFLDLSPEQIFERIKGDKNRPLLQTDNPLITLRSIYDHRKDLYLDSAHYHVNVDGKSPDEISELLFNLYNDAENFSSNWCTPLKK